MVAGPITIPIIVRTARSFRSVRARIAYLKRPSGRIYTKPPRAGEALK
jgi:hypothetical protein